MLLKKSRPVSNLNFVTVLVAFDFENAHIISTASNRSGACFDQVGACKIRCESTTPFTAQTAGNFCLVNYSPRFFRKQI